MLENIFALVTESEVPTLLIIFLILVACGLGLPVPEDITIVTSGILVSEEMTSVHHAFLVCMVGILVGDSIIYWLGRLWGKNILTSKLFSKLISQKFIEKGEVAFKRFGHKIIFLARFMPGLRAPIYFLSGSMKVSYWYFLLVDTLAAAISVPLWIWVGKVFGDNLPELEKAVKNLQTGTLLLVLILVLLFVAAHFFKKKIWSMLKN
ncbi:MAG: DedA family protein [Pseudomonadota bacterium]